MHGFLFLHPLTEGQLLTSSNLCAAWLGGSKAHDRKKRYRTRKNRVLLSRSRNLLKAIAAWSNIPNKTKLLARSQNNVHFSSPNRGIIC